ncbi:MAG: peptidoglycan bridge formation glycyltransferase FemA/FemB family protein [Patescibacteria group bacterium]
MKHPLQTKEWAEFRKEWGNEIEFVNNNLIIFSKIPHTKFTIGTVLKGSDIAKSDLAMYKQVGKNNNAIFIKFEPNILTGQELTDKYKKMGLIEGKRLFTLTSFWIDLTCSEDDLLKSFSKKTRYNIRLAQRHGVEVKIDNSHTAFEKYLELTEETNERQGFYSHSPKYHRLMWKHLKGKIANLLVAKYKDEIISTWILFNNDNFLYYPYGASTDRHKEVMANNLMMWEAIKFGKKLGCKTFDLWGREEGKGFTKFKEGYNPKVVEFIGSWDLITNKPLYYIYRIVEKIRWFILRLKK